MSVNDIIAFYLCTKYKYKVQVNTSSKNIIPKFDKKLSPCMPRFRCFKMINLMNFSKPVQMFDEGELELLLGGIGSIDVKVSFRKCCKFQPRLNAELGTFGIF